MEVTIADTTRELMQDGEIEAVVVWAILSGVVTAAGHGVPLVEKLGGVGASGGAMADALNGQLVNAIAQARRMHSKTND